MSGTEQNSEGISHQVTEIFNKMFNYSRCDNTGKVRDLTTFDIDTSASTTQTNSRLATTTSKPSRVHKNHNLIQKINANLPSYKYDQFPQQNVFSRYWTCVHFIVSTKCHWSHKTSWQISLLRSLLLSSGSDQCDWCQRVSLAPPQSVCTTVHNCTQLEADRPRHCTCVHQLPASSGGRPLCLSVHLTTASKSTTDQPSRNTIFCYAPKEYSSKLKEM